MPKIHAVISHWDQLIENFQTSSLAFYEAVEQGLHRRAVPEFKVSRVEFKEAGILTAKREYLRIVRGKCTFDICAAPFGTGFFFSWWMVEQASPFGLIFLGVFILCSFVLFWMMFGIGLSMSGMTLGLLFAFGGSPVCLLAIGFAARQGIPSELEEIILVTPFVKTLYERIFNPPTYYVVDTGLMFQQAVHNAVLEVIDQVTSANGVRALSEFERKPTLKSFAQSA
jgi:hypothetical protein